MVSGRNRLHRRDAREAVRLTFPKGAQLKERKPLQRRLDSGTVRAIDFLEGEKPPKVALQALVLEAVRLNEQSAIPVIGRSS